MNKAGHAPAGDGCYDMCGKYHRWRLTTKDPLTGDNRVKTIKAGLGREMAGQPRREAGGPFRV